MLHDPIILEVCLYTNNIKDRQLISKIKKDLPIIKTNNKKEFFVMASNVAELINNDSNFIDHLVEINGTPLPDFHNNITSVWFLNSILSQNKKLRYLKFSISEKENYTRKADETILFDYKVLQTFIDIHDIGLGFEDEERLRTLFYESGLAEPNTKIPYITTNAENILHHLDHYIQDDENLIQEYDIPIKAFLSFLDQKVENDNPKLTVILES